KPPEVAAFLRWLRLERFQSTAARQTAISRAASAAAASSSAFIGGLAATAGCGCQSGTLAMSRGAVNLPPRAGYAQRLKKTPGTPTASRSLRAEGSASRLPMGGNPGGVLSA